ncbi:hypothetical protein Skr01_40750 [Sphaerisporangium krabiense]|uniref:Uncharacterized protein n=1 Tax=Sphaerisporangium krabiense TaxID=763782 RepID=A0A7W9DSS7_9ACTN|nr:hypothetical protein [Sphaerisporangium krabiense]MBB5629888.1 hypothetical protein [Sphaerisporangium krabiense]GII63990.1 hypothetical protein Skr01_40750 [Sphaerisporangium krabiense]
MRRAAAVPPVLLAALVLSGCVSPAWDDHDYGLKAAATAEAAASGVELARQAVRGADRLTTPYLKTLLTQAADDVGGVGDQFGRVQPPSDASDRLRDRVTELTSAAEEELRGLLVEVRRDGLRDPAAADRELGDLAGRLRAVEEAYG